MNLYNEVEMDRPILHHFPEKGLLNDPNGLIEWNGEYHVFYQLNPYDTTHKNKCWGHSTSTDLLHWKRCSYALEPNSWFDKDGCYSGSAIVYKEKMYLYYTGNVLDEFGKRESYQCLATSSDGETFEKHGPVIKEISGYTAHVRDPKVWQESENEWKMILGAQRLNKTGCTLIFRSINLFDWEFLGELETGIKNFGYMWECPDLISNKKNSLLIFSPQGLDAKELEFQNIHQSGYLIGEYHSDIIFDSKTTFSELDRGFEFYAPQTFIDKNDRVIMYAWLGVMEADVERNLPSVKEGWAHILSLPRELKVIDDKLYQYPVSELKKLRGIKRNLDYSQNTPIDLGSVANEIKFELLSEEKDLEIDFYGDIRLKWDSNSRLLSISRTNWFSQVRETRSVKLINSLQEFTCYFDNSSLELFVNKGEEVFSMRMYHENIVPKIQIIEGHTSIKRVVNYSLEYK